MAATFIEKVYESKFSPSRSRENGGAGAGAGAVFHRTLLRQYGASKSAPRPCSVSIVGVPHHDFRW